MGGNQHDEYNVTVYPRSAWDDFRLPADVDQANLPSLEDGYMLHPTLAHWVTKARDKSRPRNHREA